MAIAILLTHVSLGFIKPLSEVLEDILTRFDSFDQLPSSDQVIDLLQSSRLSSQLDPDELDEMEIRV